MRIVMMGTGPFAVPTFELLCESHHEVAALFTRPVKKGPSRGGDPVNPMREAAKLRGLRIEDPVSINDASSLEILRSLQADIFVVCDYGQILSQEALGAARLGGVNLHASLLPKYRGAAPIHWALYHGDAETGVTVIHMTPKLDAGPCVGQVRVDIQDDETTAELEPRLAKLGAPLVLECIEAIERGTAKSLPQDPALATKAPRLKKEDGLVNWGRTARQIVLQMRAFNPWPKCYSYLHRQGAEPIRINLEHAVSLEKASESEIPGAILSVSKNEILVATGNGVLAIDRVQPAGKKVLTAREFLNGAPVRPGDYFGGEVS